MFLHSTREFTANQKGQLSVSKNCEFELISDQHWYWWFVRVTATGVEGFVPANILERPSERLARLNSYINVQMSPEPLKLNCSISQTKKRKSVRFSAILSTTDQDEDELSVPELDNSISPLSSDDSDSDCLSSPDRGSVLDDEDDASWTSNSLESFTPLKEQNTNEKHDGIQNRIVVRAL